VIEWLMTLASDGGSILTLILVRIDIATCL
jgi:hypothetical protein